MGEPRTDPALVERLRADLETARYDVEHLADVLGPVAVAALERENALPATLAARASDDPAATLARLLTFGDPVPVAEAEAVLPTLGLEGAQRLGLVTTDGAVARGEVDVRPVEVGDRALYHV